MRAAKHTNRQAGIALLTTMLLLLLMSSLLVGFMLLVTEGQKVSSMNDDYSLAFYSAEAGMEKITADLGTLFDLNYSPSAGQINGLMAIPPAINGIQYLSVAPPPGCNSGYCITYPQDANGNPLATVTQIKSGTYQGMTALATPYTLTVTAKTTAGTEVKLERTTQTVGIPMFQFGIFSDTDLSFFAGPDFNFGGRTHTNGNLFLADGGTLKLSDKVDAYKDIVRTNLSNGFSTETGQYPGAVDVTTAPGTTSYRALGYTEGSLVGTATPCTAPNPSWPTISQTDYFSNLVNGPGGCGGANNGTGAKQLNLAITILGAGATNPIDLIRRPPPAENPQVTSNRYFAQASLQILLSDNPADIMNMPCVDPTTQPFDLRKLAQSWATLQSNPTGDPQLAYLKTKLGNDLAPLAVSGAAYGAAVGNPYSNNDGYWIKNGSPIIPGFIKIEVQTSQGTPCGNWQDVTLEVLGYGYVGKNIHPATTSLYLSPNLAPLPTTGAYPTQVPLNSICHELHPNAIIRLERVRDNPSIIATPCAWNPGTGTTMISGLLPTDYWPNALFDTREGNMRDTVPSAPYNVMVTPAGVMQYIELDANNLAKYLAGALGGRGHSSFDPVNAPNDYVVYISDRRGNFNNRGAALPGAWPPLSYSKAETGEYGFEDFLNEASVTGCPNNSVDQGEDLDNNGTSILFTYGQDPGQAMKDTAPLSVPLVGGYQVPNSSSTDPWLGGYGAFAGPNGSSPYAALYGTMTSSSHHNAFVPYPGCSITDNFSGSPMWPGMYIVNPNEARENPSFFFRRAVKIVNGSVLNTGVCPSSGSTTINCGLTIATENPVYLQGDFNSNSAGGGFSDPNVATSIAADAVTVLSNNWNDVNSFIGPYNTGTRPGSTSWYRVAILAGKGISFPRPSYSSPQDYGTDGGVHNFLRYVEGWSGTLNYRGSIVSMYYNHQAVGAYKCCTTVYGPPARGYNFDSEFLTPALLPPRTPLFRDVNTTGWTQLLLPQQ